MAITAKDIAKQLGLSPAAVSLALRGRAGVSEETRRRVLDTAQQMGYVREERIRDPRMKMLQLVIYKRHGKVMADTPFFEQLTEGVARRARTLGYHLSVSYFYRTQDLQAQIDSIRSLKSEGILLLATEMSSTDIRIFSQIEVPILLLDNFFPSTRYDSVGIDNRHGAWNAVRYLIRCGHTRLGYLHSSVDIRSFAERQEGYLYGCQALPEGELRQDAVRRIVRVGPSTEAAAEDMHRYLAAEPMLPTAFFADNDRIAAGCCRALLESGLRIPQDISVIGFDDSGICQLLNPPLTTMGVQKERMGALAVDRLHERLSLQTPETVRTLVQPSIVVRSTVLDRNPPAEP